MVYGLEGDPTKITDEASCPSGSTDCATRPQVEDRVYCSCRCKADSANTPLCDCPGGYECREVLDYGSPGVVGSYCVKEDVRLAN